jgi:F-type H+-transporting ATPase subunit delta
MIVGSLARRYARALLDIGIAEGKYEELGRELDELAAMISGSRDLLEALTNPVFAQSRRRAVLEAVLSQARVSPVTRNVALMLLDRERIPYIPAIARELHGMVDEKAGRVRAVVTSARPLSPENAAAVQAALEGTTGRQVVLDKRQDADLIGGMVVKVGDLVYDGSVRAKLDQMRERFLSE